MKAIGERYTVAVDFDGVIHRYDSPWVAPHVIPDGPVEGAISWLWETVQRLDVVIFSTRCRTWRGRRAIRRWLREHAEALWWPAPGFRGLEEVRLSYQKPPALLFLDDRALRFEGPGTFPTVEEIHRARPWNKAGNAPKAPNRENEAYDRGHRLGREMGQSEARDQHREWVRLARAGSTAVDGDLPAVQLWHAVAAWVKKNRPDQRAPWTSGVMAALPDLAESVCGIVGWYEPEKETPDA